MNEPAHDRQDWPTCQWCERGLSRSVFVSNEHGTWHVACWLTAISTTTKATTT